MPNEDSKSAGPKKDQVDVTVTYVAAKHDFEDKHVERNATVLQVKQAAMAKFKVQEAQTGNEQVFFWLYLHDTKLEDQNRTVGDVAQGLDKIEFMLVQQIIYGA